MRKAGIGITVLAVIVLCGVVIGLGGSLNAGDSALTMTVPLDEIILSPPEGVEVKRAEVGFFHPVHYRLACISCHHTWEGTKPIASCGTSDCHDLTKSPRNLEDAPDEALPIQYYKAAYHQKCIGCHKDIKVRNKKLEMSGKLIKEPLAATGPTGCVECHPKD